MTDTDRLLFIDTDCISAFLWVKNEPLVPKIFSNVLVSDVVYDEIGKVPWMQQRIDTLINKKLINIVQIENNTIINDGESLESKTHKLYNQLLISEEIGKGEASCIALSIYYSGIVGSNNFKDVMPLVKKYNVPLITTGDILVIAVHRNLITDSDAETMWQDMLNKKRKLGAKSYKDYYHVIKSNGMLEALKNIFNKTFKTIFYDFKFV